MDLPMGLLLCHTCIQLTHNISCSITVDELREAEAERINYEQRQCFGEMIKRVPEGIQVLPISPLQKLNPVMNDAVSRAGGSLDESPISFDA